MRKILNILIVLFFWQIIYSIFHIKSIILPSPLEIIYAIFESFLNGQILIHILFSLKRVMIGFSVATAFGVAVALISGLNKYIEDLITPFVELLRPIPPIAWIPIAILLFGIGDGSSYFIVFLGAFFPIFTNSFFGVKSLPKIYKNTCATFEIRSWNFFKKILFPFSLPYIFTGMKIGLGTAWMSVIAAELIGAQSGLGYYIQLNRLMLNIDQVIVGMILIGIVGYFLTKVMSLIQKNSLPWKKG